MSSLLDDSLETLIKFESSVKSYLLKSWWGLDSTPSFESSKSYLLFGMTKCALERLKNTFKDFAEYESNLFSKITLSVKHLHATVHIKCH